MEEIGRFADDAVLANEVAGSDIPASRWKLLDAAIRVWKNQLVDLTARNSLLYYRDLRVGTLDFTGRELYVDQVLGGSPVRLSSVFAANVPRVSFAKRARAIRGKAKEAFEERGLDTMFLAHGMATWDEDVERRSRPQAPVVLVPMGLEVHGAGAQDFELQITGEPRINPTLLRKLESEFGVPIAAEEFDQQLIDAASTVELAATFSRLSDLAHTVSGFDITPKTVLGTFSYAKLPMVLDLDRARDELAQHELIAALCGDEEARGQLRSRNAAASSVRIEQPDLMPPAEEFLVLDADSSQSHAINQVLAGRDLIIQGPPGTGKSQTIANLIAALVAADKTVLFVAEKRAAIDAVFKRLHQVGLSDLLLDMHDGQKKRGAFAGELMEAVRSYRDLPEPRLEEEQRALVQTRELLTDRTNAQHGIRAPWGLSIYEARVRLAGLPDVANSRLRFPHEALETLNADVVREAKDRLRSWYDHDAPEIFRARAPWSFAAVGSITDSDAAINAAREALAAARAASQSRNAFTAETGLPEPATAEACGAQLELAAGVNESVAVFNEEFLREDLAALAVALSPWVENSLTRTRSQITSHDYRTAKKTIRQSCSDRGAALSRTELYEQLLAGSDRRASWRALAGDEHDPVASVSAPEAQATHHQLLVALRRLAEFVREEEFERVEFGILERMLDQMVRDVRTLAAMSEINPIEAWLRHHTLSDVLETIKADGLTLDEALARLDFVWLSSIVEHLALTDSLAAGLRRPDRVVREFQERDRRHISKGRLRVRRACAEHTVRSRDQNHAQSLLVERQANLKPRSRKHLPIREFFAQAPDVLRALKPCWAMSPLVVSQTLPATRELFDVVIFDEASQITPADAIPAILRGRQLVVAGDSRQLPPTAFFVSAVAEEEIDEELPADAGTEGFESVLDALAGLVPETMLRWHYRSADERLIAFSNVHIYNRSLITFPGVHSEDVISHELVEWEPGHLTGSEDSSSDEVELVVQRILEHVQDRPDESLGVIAMGIKHADRITERLRQRREQLRDGADDDEIDALDEFFAEDRREPFFVKNLERVQGDERDAIILTIGYTKDPATGRMLYRFGPLLQDGGERRLNVAVTRAKRRMAVISSFSSHDLDRDKLKSDGAKLLCAYLAYAESAGTSLGPLDELPPELNPFEIQIRDALLADGIEITPQLGVSGYRIDFAAKHPEQPGRYVLAIECDGVSYHSSPIARERDRLRQQHLERIGWRFCRIWSSDWFDDRARELERVRSAYQRALALCDGEHLDPFDEAADAPPIMIPPTGYSAPRRDGPRPAIHSVYDVREIVKVVSWVESDTLLRTRDELFWDTLRALGFERAGPKIRPAINRAIEIVRGPTKEASYGSPPLTTPALPTAAVSQLPRSSEPPAAPRTPVGDVLLPSPGTGRVQPDASELRNHRAVSIRYMPKSGFGRGSQRTVNPLHFSGNLMWAWCHKRNDVRCFNVTRISEWQPADAEQWVPPDHALAVAREAAGSFVPRSSR